MAMTLETRESLLLLDGLLADVAALLESPSRGTRRAAALKLERIAAIAATTAATIHSPRR